MGEVKPFLHFLFVSFPGQGHINPLLRFAKRVAAKGSLVTFSTTLDYGRRIRAADDSKFRVDSESELIPVGLGFLRFEFFDDGADFKDPGRDILENLMKRLETNGPSAVANLIHRQSAAGRPVSCFVNNPFIPWSLDVAAELCIPSAVLWVQSCAVFSTYYHFHHRLATFPIEGDPNNAEVHIPGIPPMASHDLPSFLLPSNPFKSLTKAILAQFNNIAKARRVFANSFEELEHDALQILSEYVPIVPVGPLIETGESSMTKIKADLWKVADNCLSWLNAQKPKAVVYVSLGSIVTLSTDEMAELAIGLKNSGRPFLWVVREEARKFLPDGFESEMEAEDRGMLVRWSPQEQVLANEAVGCFVTHCRWNSTLEVIASGVPVVAYPQWGDQVTDAKFLCEVYEVGVRLPAAATRDDVKRCIERSMEGEEAARLRNKAREWGEMARAAVAAAGSSDRNIENFMRDVRKWVTYYPDI